MKYTILKQLPPYHDPARNAWCANFAHVGTVEARNSDEAFAKAKQICSAPILESDDSRMRAAEDKEFLRANRLLVN